MHLDCLKLERFRSCLDVAINFRSDLTVLVGENNGGKSNIIDALRLLTLGLKVANRAATAVRNKVEGSKVMRRMIDGMSYTSEHLSSLRQEIIDLRNTNTRYSRKSEHSLIEQSALALRTSRLLEIRQELSNMFDSPDNPAAWWDNFRGRNRAA